MSETPKPERVTLVAPDGQRFSGPASGAEALRTKGFRDLTTDEIKEDALQKKYGEGVLPAAGAFVSGVASGATFGASDALIAQTPLAEANREVSERNPGIHTAGEVTALGLPIMGELAAASTAGKVAKGIGSAVTGVGKVAQGAGKVAQAGAEAVGLGKAAAKVVSAGTTAATEGIAFQAGHNIGEASRRNVDLDAETVWAHVGEAGLLGGGIGTVIPVAGKVVRFTADKSIAALEKSAQAIREAGFGAARLGVDAVEAGAGAVARRADDIGDGIAGGVRAGASALDRGAQAVVSRADDIGAAVEGAGQRVVREVDERLLPKIREGLTTQTGRADVIDDVFANTPAARAERQRLESQTITGVREAEAEKISKPLNEIWDQSLGHKPMLDDLAIATKRDLQANALAERIIPEVHANTFSNVVAQGQRALVNMGGAESSKVFREALDSFATREIKTVSELYAGIDDLKAVAGRLSQIEKRASSANASAGLAADAVNDFRSFTRTLLEDPAVWGEAGALQREVNAVYTRYQRAFDAFEKQFAAKGAKGQPVRVLDGQKIVKWSRDIAGLKGDVRNAVIDDLVDAQSELLAVTDRMAKQASEQARATLAGGKASPAAMGRAAALEASPDAVADVLNRSRGAIDNLAKSKASATREIDRAEVLQSTQNAILSRQGAGVNPLPVELARSLGAGTLVGGALGGMPGAIVGGGITSVLQKYGAITSNPKSAIEFLNKIDRLRGADKQKIAGWIKATLGESSESGARGALKRAADVDGKRIGATIRRGAEAVEDAAPKARELLGRGSDATARKILEARGGAERAVERVASRLDSATPDMMRRLLPAVSYADVQNSSPAEWWARTQRTIARAQANPEKLLEQVEREVEGISEDLPGVAGAIAQQKLKVLGYLADRMPRNPRPLMLGDREWTPDPGQMKAFRDLVMVTTRPETLLPLVTTGLATRAQVDAVKTLWPQTFADVRTQVTQAVLESAQEGRPVPYSARIRLGQLLGVPLDASQDRGFVQWLQKSAAPTPAPAPQQDSGAQTLSAPINIKTETGLPMSARSAM